MDQQQQQQQQQQQDNNGVAVRAFARTRRATALLALGYQLKPPKPNLKAARKHQSQVPPKQARREGAATDDGDGRKRGGGRSTRAAESASDEMSSAVESSPGREEYQKWRTMYSRLVCYRAKFGNCDVPSNGKLGIGFDHIVELGLWVREQRDEYEAFVEGDEDANRQSSLTPARIALLEKQGFRWSSCGPGSKQRAMTLDERWKLMFFRLLDFKAVHGHCDVPHSRKLGSGNDDLARLGFWVQTQRAMYPLVKKGKKRCSLTPERIVLLEEQGFRWRTRTNIPAPATLDRPHGRGKDVAEVCPCCGADTRGCRSASTSPEDDSGGETMAVGGGREEGSDPATLPPAVEVDADAAAGGGMTTKNTGGSFGADEERWWKVMFSRLVRYKAEHGHCDVPTGGTIGSGDDDVVRLGRWVGKQRSQYRKSILEKSRWRCPLTPERIRLLEEQGFKWWGSRRCPDLFSAWGQARIGGNHGKGRGKAERLVPRRPKPSKTKTKPPGRANR